MKTLSKISHHALQRLDDRIAEKYWAFIDVAPAKPKEKLMRRINAIQRKLAVEKMRRAGIDITRLIISDDDERSIYAVSRKIS